MNILERIGVVISTNINSLLDKVEDPVATLEKLVQDMERDYAEAKRQVARAIADEKRLQMKRDKAQAEAEEWRKKAEIAVRKNDDDLAKKALVRAKEQAQLDEVYSAELASQQEGTEALKSSLKALEAKMDEARRKKNILVAKHQRAQASKRISETLSGMGRKKGIFGSGPGAHRHFDRIEDKIEDLEAQAAAVKELDRDDVEAQFAEMARNDEVDDELAKLKAKMKKQGKLGAKKQ